MAPVTLLTFHKPDETERVKARLHRAGIPAIIGDERTMQKYLYLSEPLAGIHLCVDRKHYERAQDLLREWGWTNGELRDAVHCPECGASRVQYPQFTRKFLLPSLGALVGALTGFFERKYYCEHCHFTWPAKVIEQPELDLLGWPRKSAPAGPAPYPVALSVYKEGERPLPT
jgi:hypothetical protein